MATTFAEQPPATYWGSACTLLGPRVLSGIVGFQKDNLVVFFLQPKLCFQVAKDNF